MAVNRPGAQIGMDQAAQQMFGNQVWGNKEAAQSLYDQMLGAYDFTVTPLEHAIRDIDVPIEQVIALAEARA